MDESARIIRLTVIQTGSETSPHALVMSARQENIFAKEAQAYRLLGLPVPPHVLDDIIRWDQTHPRR